MFPSFFLSIKNIHLHWLYSSAKIYTHLLQSKTASITCSLLKHKFSRQALLRLCSQTSVLPTKTMSVMATQLPSQETLPVLNFKHLSHLKFSFYQTSLGSQMSFCTYLRLLFQPHRHCCSLQSSTSSGD